MSGVDLGVTLPQFTDDPDLLGHAAQRAEDAGLDSVWVFDHLWPLSGGKQRPVFEAWTALAWVAASTSRIRVGTMVTRSTLRHPAVLARMAATVASIAPGRLIVGLGSGDDLSRRENEGFGLPYWDGEERFAQLADYTEALRAAWHEAVVSLQRPFVSFDGLPGTAPSAPAPEIWLGGRSFEVLRLAARLGDGLNIWGGTPEGFASRVARLTELRGDRKVVPSWGGQAILESTDEAAMERLRTRRDRDYLVGGPRTLARELSRFVATGARHVICTFPNGGQRGPYERLAQEVRPLLDAIEAGRAAR